MSTLGQVRPPKHASRAKESGIVPSARRLELERLLAADLPQEFVRELKALLTHPLFRRREGLTASEAGRLAYVRAGFVARSVKLQASELASDPRRLYVLHEWLGLADGVACTVLGIHYCLALGSIVALGDGREELGPLVAELERVDAFGVFLATEIGFGNNVAALETEATYDAESREFVLRSPTPRSAKFMPNTACAVPKLAVVMARLVSRGTDHGVFPFLVRIRGSDGAPRPGVLVTPLTEKPGYALDNAVTRFDGVRVPKAHLLAGTDSVLHDDGRFESRTASRHRRFLRAMDRVQTGRVCFTSTVVSSLRAATWIALRYAAQRATFAPARRSVPIISYRNVQRDLFGALASAYALTFAVRHMQRCFRLRTPETEDETFRLVATLKAVATSEVVDALARLRERCGAAGMFSANRVQEYWNQAQGVITAEGDNQLMLLKVGAQLAAVPSLPPVARRTWDHPAPLDPRLALELFSLREHRLIEELKASLSARRSAADAFSAWNDSVNLALTTAEAHGQRLVAECFVAAMDEAREEENHRSLATLGALWSLERIERQAGWFLSEGCLTTRTVKELLRTRDRLCAELAPLAESLGEAFGLDNSLLHAPIAEDDYVRATLARFPLD